MQRHVQDAALLGRGSLSVKKSLCKTTDESLGSGGRHDSTRKENRILCDSRSRSEAYTSVLYCNFIDLVNEHHETGTLNLAFTPRDLHRYYTAGKSCHNCLAHGLPLVVHCYCRIIIIEDALCEVGRSECFSADIVRLLADTQTGLHQVGIVEI